MGLSANEVTAWLVSCINKPTTRPESHANDFLNAKSHAREKTQSACRVVCCIYYILNKVSVSWLFLPVIVPLTLQYSFLTTSLIIHTTLTCLASMSLLTDTKSLIGSPTNTKMEYKTTMLPVWVANLWSGGQSQLQTVCWPRRQVVFSLDNEIS